MTEHPACAVRMLGAERRFGPFVALHETRLEVPRGQSVAIFGPNGAGKTTLLRVIAGLLRPTTGTVEVFGTALPGPPELRRRIGVVMHETFLYPDLSAAENLDYYARLYDVCEPRRSEALLADLALSDFSERPVRTYSRGMSQRLALARAMLHRPDLLLLDEPLSGLDPIGAALAEALLARVRSEGVTLMFTSHDFDAGLKIAGRAVLIDRGRIAWDSGDSMPTTDRVRDAFAAASSG